MTRFLRDADRSNPVILRAAKRRRRTRLSDATPIACHPVILRAAKRSRRIHPAGARVGCQTARRFPKLT